MNRQSLVERVSAHPALAPHIDYLLSIARPCVEIAVAVAATPPRPDGGGSRFGGNAFVPPDFAWPVRDVGQYLFLGQIDFAEIPDDAGHQPPLLPTEGLLSLFYAWDEENESFAGDDGYVVACFWEDTTRHALRTAPTALTDDADGTEAGADTETPPPPPPPRRLVFVPGIDLPRHAELRADWPFDDAGVDALAELLDDGDGDSDDAREYLLGYPTFGTLAYDPTPGAGWVSLLNLSSRDDQGWCWADGDRLMVFIEAARLAARDFGNLRCDAG